jgi:hypothetical protein
MTTSQPTVAPTVEQVMAWANCYAERIKGFGPHTAGKPLEEADELWATLKGLVEALAVDADRLAQLERVVAGFPQDAIDGGWTAVGMSTCARRLEIELAAARVDAERLDWIARQGDEFSFTILIDQPGDGNYVVFGGGREGEGKTFREAVDAARTPGELPDSEGGV